MGAQRRHANAHGRTFNVAVHYLSCLVVHLHLLLGVAVGLEDVNLRYNVICQLVGELLDRNRLAVLYLAVLLLQFGHCCCTGTAGTLIACYVDAVYMAQLLDRLQHHNHHDGSAVRVGNDAARTVEGILGVALRHHEWHIVVHTERA